MGRRVVNLRDYRLDGRTILPDDVVRVDRLTRWGNPYRIGRALAREGRTVVDREGALAAYRGWLTARLAADPAFLQPLRGKRLACWCAPLPCHADVIVELLEARGG